MKRILIADDEPHIVTALEFLLKNNGYDVEVARNGDEALALMANAPPDLVLLDVMMPLRSGYDVCRQIRRHSELRAIKVVMLSAKGGQADIQKGLDAGADLYITKPFSNRELLEKISAALSHEKPPR